MVFLVSPIVNLTSFALSPITKPLTYGVGLAAEGIAHHKAKKEGKQAQHVGNDDQEFASPPYNADPSAAERQISRDSGYASHTATSMKASQADSESQIDETEELWDMDEAACPPTYEEATAPAPASPIESPSYEEATSTSPSLDTAPGLSNEWEQDRSTVKEMMQSSSSSISSQPRNYPRLTNPIILPQRRPSDRSRGFIRAYAPALQSHDISESQFLTFLKDLHTSSQSSPNFDVLMMHAAGGTYIPDWRSTIASVVVSATPAIGTEEFRGWRRGNQYLEKMNRELFEPRGLHALIMSYDHDGIGGGANGDQGFVGIREMNIMTNVPCSQAQDGLANLRRARFQASIRGFRDSSSTIGQQMEMPTAAPLVFPGLPNNSTTLSTSPRMETSSSTSSPSSSSSSSSKPNNPAKSTGKFWADYNDRRAQAKYIRDHPDDPLSVAAPQFASRYSDPNHPASSGDILALVSGGLIDINKRHRQMNVELGRQHRKYHAEHEARRMANSRRRNQDRPCRGALFRSDVLYLMIVNKPSEEALAEARRAMGA